MLITSDQAALVAAIRHSPDDDTIRLVYSDWCEENDQPIRAAFIRYQIEGNERKAMDLAKDHGLNVASGWKWISVRPGTWPERGFYKECRTDYSTISDWGDILFTEYPVLVVNMPHGAPSLIKPFEEKWPGIKFVMPPSNLMGISAGISTGSTVDYPRTVGVSWNPNYTNFSSQGQTTYWSTSGSVGTWGHQPIPGWASTNDLPTAEEVDE